MRAKVDGVWLKDWAVAEDDRFGFGIWGMTEVEDVSVRTQATDDGGTGCGVEGLALGADGDCAVIADADAGLLAPDKGPPRTSGCGPEHGAFFGAGLLLGGVGCDAEFAVDFVVVGMSEELGEEFIGSFEFKDMVSREERWEAFLPVIMAALDFAFGLGGGGIEQFDTVEVEGLAKLGEGVGVVGVEEGVEVHIEGQRQAVGLEGAGEEVEMGEEGFAWVDPCAGVVTGGIVQNIEQGLLVGIAGQPGMGAGVILPERTQITGLPAFDGFADGLVAGVGSEFVLDGPAADAGTVGFKIQSAVEFAGASAVSRGRLGGKEFFEQVDDVRRPVGLMVATGKTWGPRLRLTVGTSAEILAVELVAAGA